MTELPYPPSIAKLGHLQEEEVVTLPMTRAEFCKIVEQVITETMPAAVPPSPEVVEQVRETAKTIERFPFSEWVDEIRGCGCLVGETLIAGDMDLRRKLAADEGHNGYDDLMDMVHAADPSGWLHGFGATIDRRLADHVATANGWNSESLSYSAWGALDPDSRPLHGRDVVLLIT